MLYPREPAYLIPSGEKRQYRMHSKQDNKKNNLVIKLNFIGCADGVSAVQKDKLVS